MEPAQTRFDLFSRLLFIISALYMAASQGQGCTVYLHAIFSHRTHGRSHLIYKYRCGDTNKIHISSFPLSFPPHFVSPSWPQVQLAGPASARLSLENPSLRAWPGALNSPRESPPVGSVAAGLPLGPSHNRLPFPVAGLTHRPPDLLRSLGDPCRVEGEEGLEGSPDFGGLQESPTLVGRG